MGLFDDKKSSDNESFPVGTQQYKFPVSRNDIIVCATHGNIYAMHKQNGTRIWRADFPKGSTSIFSLGSMGGIISIFITDQDDLIIASSGKTACLDLYTGAEKWVNKMKDLGHDEVGVVCTPSRALKPQNSGASPTSEFAHYEKDQHQYFSPKQVAVVGTSGYAMGIDVKNGEELWRFDCPKGGYKLPSTLVDPQGTIVYVGCGTRLYCLDAVTGQLLWETKVSNSMSGVDYMTMATPWSSRLAAEAHTAFSLHPSAQKESHDREESARRHR